MARPQQTLLPELVKQFGWLMQLIIFPILIGAYYSVRYLDEKAPISYVDKRVDEASRLSAQALETVAKNNADAIAAVIKRSDEQYAQTLKEAFAHSDDNRQKMEIARAQDMAATREAMAKVSSLVDQAITALREMRSEAWGRDRRTPPRN